MIPINGKPIIGHILDNLKFPNIEEIILVVGYKKEQIIEYVDKCYSDKFNITYINQDKLCGLGHAIYLASDYINSETIISLGDIIFMNYPDFNDIPVSIAIDKSKEPQKYGVVTLYDKKIKSVVEKPQKYISDNIMVGLYYINDTNNFLKFLDMTYQSNINKEFSLTQVFQNMINDEIEIEAFNINGWYDCGNLQELFRTNQILSGESNGKC